MKSVIIISLLCSLVMTGSCICDIESTLKFENPYLCAFLQNATNDVKEEFTQIYVEAVNLTQEELNNKLKNWVKKQGSQIEEGFRKYLADEADYWNRRYEALMRRIKESNATNEAKNELIEVINFEQDMDTKFGEYEAKLKAIKDKYNKDVDEEATKLWNTIDTPDMQ